MSQRIFIIFFLHISLSLHGRHPGNAYNVPEKSRSECRPSDSENPEFAGISKNIHGFYFPEEYTVQNDVY